MRMLAPVIKKKSLLALLLGGFLCLSSLAPAYAQSAFNDPGTVAPGTSGAGGGVAPVEAKVEAGTVALGTTSQVVVRFKNDSGADVQFRDIKLFPSSSVSAETISDQCSTEALAPAAECAVILGVKGLQSGAFRVEVLVRHSGRSRLVTATVTGSTEAGDANQQKATDIEISPAPIEFGTLEASRPIIRSVTLRNITSQNLTLKRVYVDAPNSSGFDLKTECKTLMAGQACIASIIWSPLIAGPSSGFLVVEHSGPSAVASIAMTGDFKPTAAAEAPQFPDMVPGKGLLVASETEIDFGDEVASESSITISLVNIGDAPVMLKDIQMSGSEHGLKLMRMGCTEGMVLEPTEACPLTTTWTPTKAGTVIDDIKVTHSGARGVLVVPIRGESEGSVNVDTKPVVIVEGRKQVVNESAPPVMDGYTVTSLARTSAIISGPGGSRIVKQGQSVMLGGREWTVVISEEGVQMNSASGNNVLLVFDRSLSASTGANRTSSESAGADAQNDNSSSNSSSSSSSSSSSRSSRSSGSSSSSSGTP